MGNSDGGEVAFYPFLIVCESLDGEKKQTLWLPYWHIVTYADGRPGRTKYGQWAPPYGFGHLRQSC